MATTNGFFATGHMVKGCVDILRLKMFNLNFILLFLKRSQEKKVWLLSVHSHWAVKALELVELTLGSKTGTLGFLQTCVLKLKIFHYIWFKNSFTLL